MVDEKEIIERLKKNEKDIFRTVVEKYQPYVMNICIGFLHNKEDAEDITQEIFIEFHQSVSKFRGDSKLSTWLYRISVNKSLNHIRKNKKFKKHVRMENAQYKENSQTENPESVIWNSEKHIALQKAMHSLPDNQKTAFILSKYNDLSYEEISKVMNKSLSSVESLIHRAKLNLQKKLMGFYKNNME